MPWTGPSRAGEHGAVRTRGTRRRRGQRARGRVEGLAGQDPCSHFDHTVTRESLLKDARERARVPVVLRERTPGDKPYGDDGR